MPSGNLNPPLVLWTVAPTVSSVPVHTRFAEPARAPLLLNCTCVSEPPGTAAGAADTQPEPVLVSTLPVGPTAVMPVPPCPADSAVVRPEIDVMSLFAPLAAAVSAERPAPASAAVNTAWPTALAPRATCAAAWLADVNTAVPVDVPPRLMSAAFALVAPVPPCEIGITPAVTAVEALA